MPIPWVSVYHLYFWLKNVLGMSVLSVDKNNVLLIYTQLATCLGKILSRKLCFSFSFAVSNSVLKD